MTHQAKPQLKRTAAALDSIIAGKRFVIPTRKWTDPIDLNRGGFLRIDGEQTTLRSYRELEHLVHNWTADDIQLICAVLRDEQEPRRFWLWVWHSDRGVHIVEPAGIDVETLSKNLAQRFPHA